MITLCYHSNKSNSSEKRGNPHGKKTKDYISLYAGNNGNPFYYGYYATACKADLLVDAVSGEDGTELETRQDYKGRLVYADFQRKGPSIFYILHNRRLPDSGRPKSRSKSPSGTGGTPIRLTIRNCAERNPGSEHPAKYILGRIHNR